MDTWRKLSLKSTIDVSVKPIALLGLAVTLCLVLAPLGCVLILSFGRGQVFATNWAMTFTLEWYSKLPKEVEGDIWRNTLMLVLPVAVIGAIGGFVCALNWWIPARAYTLLALGFGVTALPSAAYAVAFVHCFRLLGLTTSSLFVLIAADVLWVLPFCTVIIMAGIGHIQENQVRAAIEMAGGKRRTVIRSVILPPVFPSFLSALLVALLLSTNEYVRSTYMSGATQLMSKYVYGRMSSGTDPTVYALTGVNLVFAFVVVLLAFVGNHFSKQLAR
jgi:ABC-type spermidine/putrescine transport system permease subunit II